MLRNTIIALCASLLAGHATPAATSSPVALHGQLSVKGGKVVDAVGRPTTLRGMSLFWSQTDEGGKYYNTKAVNWLVTDWNASLVRAAMAVVGYDAQWGGHPEKAYVSDSAGQMKLVRTVVDAAIANGIYVIVDWHDDDAPSHLEKAKSFFKTMSELYGDKPNVIWEIWNEPKQIPWATIKSYAETITPIIRKNSKNLIIVGTPSWSLNVDAPIGAFLPDTNTCYTVHFYTGTDNHNAPAREAVRSVLRTNHAVFATEWGTSTADGNGGPFLDNAKIWMDFLDSAGISSANWAVDNKNETSAALVSSAADTGGWPTNNLTASGAWIRNRLRSYKDTSSPASIVPHPDRTGPRLSLVGGILRLKTPGWEIVGAQDVSGRNLTFSRLNIGAYQFRFGAPLGLMIVQLLGPDGARSVVKVTVPRE